MTRLKNIGSLISCRDDAIRRIVLSEEVSLGLNSFAASTETASETGNAGTLQEVNPTMSPCIQMPLAALHRRLVYAMVFVFTLCSIPARHMVASDTSFIYRGIGPRHFHSS